MKKKLVAGLAMGLFMFGMVGIANAAVVYDDFNDGTLGNEWNISFSDNVLEWTYTEFGTNLTVTDIATRVVYPVSSGQWDEVTLSQSFMPLADYHVDFDISWDSEGSRNAMQYLSVGLFDIDGNLSSYAAYRDSWDSERGRKHAQIANDTFVSGFNDLPFAGSASIDIARTGSNVDILWNGSTILSGISNRPVDYVEVKFGYYPVDAWDEPPSFFGSESVDLVDVDAVPVPASVLLLGSGIAGLAGSRIRRKKK